MVWSYGVIFIIRKCWSLWNLTFSNASTPLHQPQTPTPNHLTTPSSTNGTVNNAIYTDNQERVDWFSVSVYCSHVSWLANYDPVTQRSVGILFTQCHSLWAVQLLLQHTLWAWSIWLYRLCRKKNTLCQSDRFAWTYSGRPSNVFHPSSRKTVEGCVQLTFQNGSPKKHGTDMQRLCCNIIRNINLVHIIRTYTEHYHYAQTK